MASAQVAHFEPRWMRPESAWVPPQTRCFPMRSPVQWATPYRGISHAPTRTLREATATFSTITRAAGRCSRERTGWFHQPLDLERMRKAVALSESESMIFPPSGPQRCQAKSPVRLMQHAGIRAERCLFPGSISPQTRLLHHMCAKSSYVSCMSVRANNRRNGSRSWLPRRTGGSAAPDFLRGGLCTFLEPIRRALEPAGVSADDAVRLGIRAMRERESGFAWHHTHGGMPGCRSHGADAVGLNSIVTSTLG